ncbi:MAG: hypothetical protein ABI876_13880 [Bacteroidota bacterium]
MEDLLALIRSTCTRTFEADHESAIRAIARELGFLRVSANVRRVIQPALAAALDRAIIHNDRGIYRIDCRAIGEYPDELLQTYLPAAIGRAWKSHEEALRATARYLGFRKVGPAMREFLEAAIAHCIRAGTLKADGDWLRRK